jgi:hypothetical protein
VKVCEIGPGLRRSDYLTGALGSSIRSFRVDLLNCRRSSGSSWFISLLVRGSCFPALIDAQLFHSDYVFDGTSSPYAPSAPTNPVNHYGITKRDGELAVLGSEGAQGIVLRVPVL